MIPVIAEVVGIAQPVPRLGEHVGQRELVLVLAVQVCVRGAVPRDVVAEHVQVTVVPAHGRHDYLVQVAEGGTGVVALAKS